MGIHFKVNQGLRGWVEGNASREAYRHGNEASKPFRTPNRVYVTANAPARAVMMLL